MRPAIVVAAYDRPHCLERLLESLKRAVYPGQVDLVISIDGGGSAEVLRIAREFCWRFGEKTVLAHPTHLGLRQHILSCGDLSQPHGAIILLEDDLFVSPAFYLFAQQACEFYRDVPQVAGIALYSPRFNETANLPFEPRPSSDDVFFLQRPCSWGQLWTAHQWRAFRAWYDNGGLNALQHHDPRMPLSVHQWPETSWKKFFTRYMVENDSYFVYPWTAFTTNFGDAGTHFIRRTPRLQVPINCMPSERYRFRLPLESQSRYDAFYENLAVIEQLRELHPSDVTVDLYGTKPIDPSRRFLLTTKRTQFRIERRFELSMRPIEESVFQNIEGRGIYLYDTAILTGRLAPPADITLEDYFAEVYLGRRQRSWRRRIQRWLRRAA